MPSPQGSETLARDITAFLDAALIERVPERDIPAAESLCVRMVSTWPVDDDGWDTARRHVAEPVAEHFVARTHDWARALDLMALYLDSAALDEAHPREGEFRFSRRGKELHRVELDLARAFAEALLEQADTLTRIRLFEALDSWESWPPVVRALESLGLELDPAEALTLVSSAIKFSWGDSANDTILDHVKKIMSLCPESVDAILEGWLIDDEAYVDADVRAIGVLALWRLPQHPNPAKTRRRLVYRLARLPVAGFGLAPRVAFRSWSKDAPFLERRRLLLTTLERMGDPAVSAALAALAHDPDTLRSDALDLLDAIVEQATTVDENGVIEIARVLHWIAEDPNHVDAAALVHRLPPPDGFTVRSLPWLDRTLSRLARLAPEPVREYVLNWIETSAAELGSGQSLTRLLGQTRKALPGDAWMIEAAVSKKRPALRAGATRCLVEGRPDERRPGFEALTKRQVHALALQILTQVTAGAAFVNLLFELARARPDCLDVLVSLLGDPTIRTYPGRHRRCVEAWAETLAGRPDDDPEVQAVARLQAFLDARDRAAKARFSVREVLFEPTLPVRGPMGEIFTREMRKVMRSQESPLLAMATKVPIACGEATTMDFGDGDARTPSPLKTYENAMEGLYLDNYDPIAAMLERMDYARQVEQLLTDPNSGEAA